MIPWSDAPKMFKSVNRDGPLAHLCFVVAGMPLLLLVGPVIPLTEAREHLFEAIHLLVQNALEIENDGMRVVHGDMPPGGPRGQNFSTTQSPLDSTMWNWWMLGRMNSLQRDQIMSPALPTKPLIIPSGVSTQSNSGSCLSSKRYPVKWWPLMRWWRMGMCIGSAAFSLSWIQLQSMMYGSLASGGTQVRYRYRRSEKEAAFPAAPYRQTSARHTHEGDTPHGRAVPSACCHWIRSGCPGWFRPRRTTSRDNNSVSPAPQSPHTPEMSPDDCNGVPDIRSGRSCHERPPAPHP